VTACAEPVLDVGGVEHIFEESTASSLGGRVALRQLRRRAPARERPERRRTEERIGNLELRDAIEVSRFGDGERLRVIVNRSGSLHLQRWLPPVEHQHGIEPGRIDRRRNAASQDHFTRAGIVGEADVVGQRNVHEDGGVIEHPRHAMSVAVVAAVVDEQRVVRIGGEPALRVLRRNSARLVAVAREARAPIAAERFALEELLAVHPVADAVALP